MKMLGNDLDIFFLIRRGIHTIHRQRRVRVGVGLEVGVSTKPRFRVGEIPYQTGA